MKWIPLMIKCTILSWLAWFIFWSMLCMRELFGIPLELPWLALFWVLLAFLDQPFWLLQLSISNVPQITTSMLAFQAPHLVYLQKAACPYTREKWPLSKEPFLTLTWNDFVWLIHMMDLTWCVTLNPSLSPFLFTYLSPFLSTKWFLIVTRT